MKEIKGPLAGREGELITVNGKSKVAVRLDLLGCAHVYVPIGFVEKRGGGGIEGQKNKKTKEIQKTKEKQKTKETLKAKGIQKRRQQEEKAVR